MENRIITIENGIVHIPNEVRMSIAGIADLFDIFYRTAKREIRSIEKSDITSGDYSMSCVCDGSKVYPDYYGLEMIIAVAFRVQSVKAEEFRRWIYRRAVRAEIPEILMLPTQNSMLN